MTTPPTPAGWYPDPDGSGGQRYWDGFTWTEHLAPASPPPPVAPEPPIAPEPPASEQPTAIVTLPPTPSGERVGAHRAPESADEPPAEPAEPEPGPTAPVAQPTAPITYSPPSAEQTRPEPAAFGAPPAPPLSGPPPATADGPSAPGDNRQLIIRFGVACVALLAVLVLVVIYAAFIHKDDSIQIGAPDTTTTSKSASTTTSPTETATETDSPTTVPAAGEVTDGPLSFTVTGVERGTTVTSDDAPVEKTAQGEYIVVHMTVTDTGTDPATFLGNFQRLKAAGITYYPDDEATFYVGGGLAELNPGDSADVAVAFDVPPGSTPDAIELHADPVSPGVEVTLS